MPASPATPFPTRDLEACLLCGSRELSPQPFAYEFEGVVFPGARCRVCRFVFLRRQPVGEGFRRMYDPRYFESDYHCGHEERPYFASEQTESHAAERLLDWIERDVPRGRLLEIGSAGGYFLQAARERGWEVTGVEISEDAARFARDTLGLDVRTGTLESVFLEPGSFDVAYMGDVLEHVPEPMEALRRLHTLVRPGGVVVIVGPATVHSLDRRLGLAALGALGRTRILRQAPYHLSEFVPATLRFALERAGFRVERLRQSKIPPRFRNVRKRPPLEHLAKGVLDVPNWLVTRLAGRLGDRVAALARRPRMKSSDTLP
jgi:2-polyprenyl-3-methyl-5-hydroxy-6-metoxy-1,4-benzoquinol methylase